MCIFSLFNKEKPYKIYFERIARTVPFYVDGVDIFDDTNRKFLKKVNIRSSAPQKVLQANLYTVYGSTKTFKLAIAQFLPNIYTVAYLHGKDFRAAYNAPQYSNRRNRAALCQWCLQRVALKNQNDGYIYSYDNSHRAKITTREKDVKVEIERLEIWPDVDIDFPQSEKELDTYAWSFEHVHTSYYADEQTALKNINREFSHCSKTID